MPQLFGRGYSRSELAAFTGRLDTLAGVTPLERAAGRGRGVRELSVRTGSGFSFVSVADRALDVALASYGGVPLCWRSCNDVAAPAYADHEADGFLRTFAGGLFTTCGLANFGPAGSDAWGTFGLHGRINLAPAESVRCETSWPDEHTCVFEVAGTMRETQVFGENFRLERRLRAFAGGRSLQLHDTVTNEAGTRRPHMILYHCNGGFPILAPDARLYVSHASVRPRDAQAARGLAVWDRGAEPRRDFEEQVFVHEPIACADGRAAAVLWNPQLCEGRGLGLAIRFDPVQLPAFFTWRMLAHGTYVMGMEPANCPTIEGRVEAGKRGTLPFLEPGESRSYDLEFSVLTGTDELAVMLGQIGRANGAVDA
ncbi:MAG TPA: aldose 1-epimerase family protein [Candidatus Sulfotelmatobacter sp.]|nr:aldose 1-epimerase family protein [Candidatus Sulfotelmatobacter sp.]